MSLYKQIRQYQLLCSYTIRNMQQIAEDMKNCIEACYPYESKEYENNGKWIACDRIIGAIHNKNEDYSQSTDMIEHFQKDIIDNLNSIALEVCYGNHVERLKYIKTVAMFAEIAKNVKEIMNYKEVLKMAKGK